MIRICLAANALLIGLFAAGNVAAQPVLANAHAPIGVMGDHIHHMGEWMVSYRFMHMDMAGNRIGPQGSSPDTIVTSVPNRFFGMPMQPPTLRVVPTSMTMNMHMLGVMYAPSDRLTLMAMGNYVSKDMAHITYQGPSGTNQLGRFDTSSSGIGDTTLTALVRLTGTAGPHVHLNIGFDLPTGSNTETGTVLAPTGARPTLRLPYAMQIGGGTYDFKPGATYTGGVGALSWGVQYLADISLGRNDEGYAHGDAHALTGWIGYAFAPWIGTFLRLAGETQQDIEGLDPSIVAPVQTADPRNYGGQRLDLMFGVNLAGQQGALRGHRLGLEVGIPVHQDLNGPQMENEWSLTIGWQKML